MEGRDLLPLIEEAEGEWPNRFLFTHHGRWYPRGTPEEARDIDWAVRNQRFRLVGPSNPGGQAALFDMVADPGQENEVTAEHPEAMRQAYAAFWAETLPLMINEGVEMAAERPFWQAYQAQKRE